MLVDNRVDFNLFKNIIKFYKRVPLIIIAFEPTDKMIENIIENDIF